MTETETSVTIMPGAESKRPSSTIDGGWAWMVVVGVFINMFFLMGLAKSSGMFIVEFLNYFEVSATSASAPMTLAFVLYAIAVPIATVLGEVLTPRKVVLVGSVIASVGYALSSLLTSMTFVVITFGVAMGVGLSSSYGNGMVMIGHYFNKRRSLATGIAMAGTSIGQFAMPSVIEFLMANFSLRGTLLMSGALYFHCCISGALFRPIDHNEVAKSNGEIPRCDSSDEDQNLHYADEKLTVMSTTDVEVDVDNMQWSDSQEVKETFTTKENVKAFTQKEENCHEDTSLVDEKTKTLSGKHRDGVAKLSTCSDRKSYTSHNENEDLKDLRGISTIEDCIRLSTLYLNEKGDVSSMKSHEKPSFLMLCRSAFNFSILKNAVVVMCAVESFLTFMGMISFTLFTPAIAQEKGMIKYERALLLSLTGLGDLIARVTIGIFSDFNIIARYKIRATVMMLTGIFIIAFNFASSFPVAAALSFFIGIFSGGIICLLPVVLVDFVGLKLMAQALALVLLAQGLGGAVGQPVMGALRDSTGSFQAVNLISGVLLLLSSSLLFLYPFIRKLQNHGKAL